MTENVHEYRRYQTLATSDSAKEACATRLKDLHSFVPGLISAGVVGPDGFEVAAISNRSIEVSKIAALTSTLVAVAEAFTTESGSDPCREIVLSSNRSATILLGVGVGPATYSLYVIAGEGVTLGSALSRARVCAREVQESLSGCLQVAA